MTNHRFIPDHYFSTIGTHPPVLHIKPGDTVTTDTIDAFGRNASGQEVATGSNPMTGPFYINGAEPGDMLVVHLQRIVPTCKEGWTTFSLASNVLDPAYLPELPYRPRDPDWHAAVWELDPAAWTATLRSPQTSLGALCLPLDPMLGCFGVAPSGEQAITTATSGAHGGNMDYRGHKAGTTVYFPVFVPGALFFLGDGHAVQGDGEISGTGIETSMEVEFSVELVKNKLIRWPRGENAEYLFTTGNARPLDQALQHATSELVRWLKEDYHLDPAALGLLLGQVVEYEVGNVFDPAYTMVCKIKKSFLK
jgi:acetamidase/formamidase